MHRKIGALVLVLSGLAALPLPALGQDDEESHEASVSLGYVGTTGNTKTHTFNTEVLSSLRFSNWEHRMKFQALASSEESRARAERYYFEDKSDYRISEAGYLYLKGHYTDDRFSGFNYQAALSGGYGRYFFRDSDFTLEGFAGVGYRVNEIRDGGTQSEVIILSVGETLEWQLSEAAVLTQNFTSEVGEELTVSKFEIGLITNIIGQVSTKIAFQARNISDVPAGTHHTDTQTSLSLVYDF